MMNLNDSIIFALNILGDCNQMLHDFWVSELYDEDDDPITNVWNDATLAMIEKDVMMQIEANWHESPTTPRRLHQHRYW